jgi:hypothetical protein
VGVASILAAAVLILAGWGHRALLGAIDAALGQLVQPQQPLSSVPLRLGAWGGEDVPIDERILQVGHFDDDFISRVYRRADGTTVNLFVGYQGRPRARFGHRPDACFPAHGWEPTSKRSLAVEPDGGIPGVLYEFAPRNELGRPARVLASYLVNGRYTPDPGGAERYVTRSVFGARPAYITRIQVTLTGGEDAEEDVVILREFMSAVAGAVAACMPYWES